jgi:thiamine-monophosphate kinase
MESEESLIRRIVQAVPSSLGRGQDGLRLGIGDDAAVLEQRRGLEWVVSCDAFLEGVHFRVKTHPPDSVGYKALARATSDLAAMGAVPRLFLMTVAIPANRTGQWLDRFLAGMSRAARQFGMRLAGGDTTRSDGIYLNITVLGQVAPSRALTRSGARPGDLIYVSGKLGAAKLGLDLVLGRNGQQGRYSKLVGPHLYPKIPIQLGSWLSQQRIASAAIDISDGLSTDLTRLARASDVGALIQADRVPTVSIPEAASSFLRHRTDPLKAALNGGEDYELLFTVPPARVRLLHSAPGFRNLACIGEITRGSRILLAGGAGKTSPVKPQGWDPFRK